MLCSIDVKIHYAKKDEKIITQNRITSLKGWVRS